MIDALDELLTPLDENLKGLSDFVEDNLSIPIVVSCRNGFDVQQKLSNFTHLFLEDLTFGDAKRYVEGQSEFVQKRLQSYFDDEEKRALLTNPFFLKSLVTQAQLPSRRMPDTKAELYDMFVNQYQPEERSADATAKERHDEKRREDWRKVAYIMLMTGNACLSKDEIATIKNTYVNLVECLLQFISKIGGKEECDACFYFTMCGNASHFIDHADWLERLMPIVKDFSNHEAINAMAYIIYKSNKSDVYCDYLLEKESSVHSFEYRIVPRSTLYLAFGNVCEQQNIETVLARFTDLEYMRKEGDTHHAGTTNRSIEYVRQAILDEHTYALYRMYVTADVLMGKVHKVEANETQRSMCFELATDILRRMVEGTSVSCRWEYKQQVIRLVITEFIQLKDDELLALLPMYSQEYATMLNTEPFEKSSKTLFAFCIEKVAPEKLQGFIAHQLASPGRINEPTYLSFAKYIVAYGSKAVKDSIYKYMFTRMGSGLSDCLFGTFSCIILDPKNNI